MSAQTQLRSSAGRDICGRVSGTPTGIGDETVAADKSWVLTQTGYIPDEEAAIEARFALSNGTLGIRGVIEERRGNAPSAFLAGVYERTPIHYHERHFGFASSTDTRVPVPDGLCIAVKVDDEAVDLDTGEILEFERRLDMRRGVLQRRLKWRSPTGKTVLVTSERLVPLGNSAVVIVRYAIEAVDCAATLTIDSSICAEFRAARQDGDPRIGAELNGGGLRIDGRHMTPGCPGLTQRTTRSGIAVACVQRHVVPPELCMIEARETPEGISETFHAGLLPGERIAFEKVVAYASSDTSDKTDSLLFTARSAAQAAASMGFAALDVVQEKDLAEFWATVDLGFDDDCGTLGALRFNMFHIFQSASRNGKNSIPAKGLTGEGYEGHYFWDTEAFVLPVVALAAPQLARLMLEYRFRTLAAARAHARELNIESGALYAWRTISGDECSAHYPSGSAQYHINAAIAFAVRLYDRATGDFAFLTTEGGEIVFETARVWIELGHFNARRGGRFCIDGVTGPDEYTTLVDNNYYTNKMAQLHLRYAAELAGRLGAAEPQAYEDLRRRIGLSDDEVTIWQRAADAMLLPWDETLGINPQDDTFLDKKRWDFVGTPAEHYPLLLHYHPMSLYRRQVCKQADVVLAMVLAGDDVDAEVKRRNFEYYDALTTHDSTLSMGTFSILASEIGESERARAYFDSTLFTDLRNLHGNTEHGIHLAAMAGSWLGLAWGFGGLRCDGKVPRFVPVLPERCNGYRFGLVWLGSRIRVSVTAERVEYELVSGPECAIRHRREEVLLRNGVPRCFPLGPASARAGFPDEPRVGMVK